MLRREIRYWTSIYEERYRDIRNKVFAHNEISDLAEINASLAGTNIYEMKALFRFLAALEAALWNAFHNGIAPDLSAHDQKKMQGEKVYQQGGAVLQSMLAASAVHQK